MNNMQPTWQTDDGAIRLYCADCLDVLPTLDAGSVDAALFDPPYGINHVSSSGASWEGTEILGDDDVGLRDFAWNHFRDIPRAAFGLSWKQPAPPDVRCVLIWDKRHVGCGDLRIPWKPSWEEIYIGGYGWDGSRDEGVLRGPAMITWETGPAHDGNGRKHPHQKPEWLFLRLIKKLPHAQTICDPFMGSGTTGVAAIRTGRRFIGIEKEERYFDISVRRIQQELERFPLFQEEKMPVQGSLLECE